MGNRITIEPTKFEDVRTGAVSYGYRAYDDYDSTYCNQWESIPDDDLEFLALVMEEVDDTVKQMLFNVTTFDEGLYVGNTYYEWKQIAHLWDKVDQPMQA